MDFKKQINQIKKEKEEIQSNQKIKIEKLKSKWVEEESEKFLEVIKNYFITSKSDDLVLQQIGYYMPHYDDEQIWGYTNYLNKISTDNYLSMDEMIKFLQKKLKPLKVVKEGNPEDVTKVLLIKIK